MDDVLFWYTAVNQHSGQSGVKWLMFYSGTQQSIRIIVVNVLFWNTVANQE